MAHVKVICDENVSLIFLFSLLFPFLRISISEGVPAEMLKNVVAELVFVV